MKSLVFILSAFIGFSGSVATLAHGDTAYGNALIDWNTLVITTDPGVNITWTEKQTFSYGVVWNNILSGHYDRQDSPVDGWSSTSASAYSPYYAGEARGWGLASSNSLSGYTSISSDHGNGLISADGGSGRWGAFIVSGNGNIAAQVNYSLLSDLQRSMVDGGYAYADPDARIRLDNYSDSAYVFDNDDLNVQSFGIGTNSDNRSGTLKLTLAFTDGETGKFSAAAYGGVSQLFAVPEAFSLALLLFGLVGLAGVKRKIR